MALISACYDARTRRFAAARRRSATLGLFLALLVEPSDVNGILGLRVLSLTGTRVSDAGLEDLRAHENLRLLELSGTGVSEAGVASFRAAHPGCTVRHR